MAGKRKRSRGPKLVTYIDTRVQLLQEEIDRRMNDQNRAIDKAQTEMNRRLEGMNEFRDAMRDQAGQMMTKDAFTVSVGAEKDRADIVHRTLADRIDKIEDTLTAQAGAVTALAGRQASVRMTTGQVLAVIGVVIAAVSVAVSVILATRP